LAAENVVLLEEKSFLPPSLTLELAIFLIMSLKNETNEIFTFSRSTYFTYLDRMKPGLLYGLMTL